MDIFDVAEYPDDSDFVRDADISNKTEDTFISNIVVADVSDVVIDVCISNNADINVSDVVTDSDLPKKVGISDFVEDTDLSDDIHAAVPDVTDASQLKRIDNRQLQDKYEKAFREQEKNFDNKVQELVQKHKVAFEEEERRHHNILTTVQNYLHDVEKNGDFSCVDDTIVPRLMARCGVDADMFQKIRERWVSEDP
jgi:hypothetical protein